MKPANKVRAIAFSDLALIVMVLLGCAAAAFLVWPARAATPPVPIPREVLVFYYGWYGTPSGSGQWRHWDQVDEAGHRIGNSTNYPQGGPYDSHDPKVIDRHLRQMRDAGITGLVTSWWGKTFEDRTLDIVAAEAPKFGIKISAYYEALSNNGEGQGPAARIDTAVADISYLLDRHGRDQSWLRVAGRPVLFIYARAISQLGVGGWRQVADRLRSRADAPLLIGDLGSGASAYEMRAAFAGVHSYNDSPFTAGMDGDAVARWARRTFPARLKPWAGKIRCLTIYPAFDNRKAARNPDPRAVTPRNDGRTLSALGEAALAAQPDWLLVTSWNEWHEGTEVEPSVEYGDRPLKEVRRLARRFRALPPRALSLDLPAVAAAAEPGATR